MQKPMPNFGGRVGQRARARRWCASSSSPRRWAERHERNQSRIRIVSTSAIAACSRSPAGPQAAQRLLGRLDRRPAHRDAAALGSVHSVDVPGLVQRTRSCRFSSPFADCSVSPLLLLYDFQRTLWKTCAPQGQLFRSSVGPSRQTARPGGRDRHAGLPARQHVIAGTCRSFIRRSGGRAQLGGPFLPALQLGDERQLVPLVPKHFQRQQRQQSSSPPGATCTTSSSAGTTNPHMGLVCLCGGRSPLPRPQPLYPGNQYVDWTCIDGFNWGSNPPTPQVA